MLGSLRIHNSNMKENTTQNKTLSHNFLPFYQLFKMWNEHQVSFVQFMRKCLINKKNWNMFGVFKYSTLRQKMFKKYAAARAAWFFFPFKANIVSWVMWSMSMFFNQTKRKHLHKNIVHIDTLTWLPWRHVKTLYSIIVFWVSRCRRSRRGCLYSPGI